MTEDTIVGMVIRLLDPTVAFRIVGERPASLEELIVKVRRVEPEVERKRTKMVNVTTPKSVAGVPMSRSAGVAVSTSTEIAKVPQNRRCMREVAGQPACQGEPQAQVAVETWGFGQGTTRRVWLLKTTEMQRTEMQKLSESTDMCSSRRSAVR